MNTHSVELEQKTYELAQTIAEAHGISVNTLIARLIVNHARSVLKLDEEH